MIYQFGNDFIYPKYNISFGFWKQKHPKRAGNRPRRTSPHSKGWMCLLAWNQCTHL